MDAASQNWHLLHFSPQKLFSAHGGVFFFFLFYQLKVQNNSKIQSVLDQKGVQMFLCTVWLPGKSRKIDTDSLQQPP